MKERDAGERQTEEHEIDRHAERDARGRDDERAGEKAAFARQ